MLYTIQNLNLMSNSLLAVVFHSPLQNNKYL